jgi:hypothetical protein
MTLTRISLVLAAATLGAAALPTHAGEVAAARPRVSEAVKARQEADRQRLVAKLRGESPKRDDRQAKTSVLDLPIFHRYDRP